MAFLIKNLEGSPFLVGPKISQLRIMFRPSSNARHQSRVQIPKEKNSQVEYKNLSFMAQSKDSSTPPPLLGKNKGILARLALW